MPRKVNLKIIVYIQRVSNFLSLGRYAVDSKTMIRQTNLSLKSVGVVVKGTRKSTNNFARVVKITSAVD